MYKKLFGLFVIISLLGLVNIQTVCGVGTIGYPAVYMIGGKTTMTNLNYNETSRILTVDLLGPNGTCGSLFLIFNISLLPKAVMFDNITFTELDNITTPQVNMTVIYLEAFQLRQNITVPALNLTLSFHFSTHHVEVNWNVILQNNTQPENNTEQEQENQYETTIIPLSPVGLVVSFVATFAIIFLVMWIWDRRLRRNKL